MGIRGVFTESLIPIGIWTKVIMWGGECGGFIARGAMKPHRRQAKTSVVWGKSGRKVRFRGLPAIGIRSGNSGFLRAAYYRGIRRTRRPGTREKEIGFDGVNAGWRVLWPASYGDSDGWLKSR